MDPLIGLAWMGCGAVIGVVLTLVAGPVRQRRAAAPRQTMADSQMRRALERMREEQHDLSAQLDAAEQRHARAMDALKLAHAREIGELEDQLRQEHRKMQALVEATTKGHVISGTSFENTRFED